jgi:hypothetical protein
MGKLERYFHEKSMMMMHLAFAVRNESMDDLIYQLLCYHYHKDFAQKKYFEMSHE